MKAKIDHHVRSESKNKSPCQSLLELSELLEDELFSFRLFFFSFLWCFPFFDLCFFPFSFLCDFCFFDFGSSSSAELDEEDLVKKNADQSVIKERKWHSNNLRCQYFCNVTNWIWCRICTVASTGKLMISESACLT